MKKYDVVQVIYDMSDNGEVEIVVRGNSDSVIPKNWETIISHEFTSEEALNGKEFIIPVSILHALEKELLKGSRIIRDEWRD